MVCSACQCAGPPIPDLVLQNSNWLTDRSSLFSRLIAKKSNTVYVDPKHVWILEPPTRHDVSNVCYRFHVFPGIWHPAYHKIPANKERCEAARSLCNKDCLCHEELEEHHTQGAGFVGKLMDQTGQVSDLVCEPWDRSSKAGK